MDSKHESVIKLFDVNIEKANAISKYQKLQRITNLFRFMEMFVFLVMISRFSYQLPFSAKVSSDYFRRITSAISSPKFVFVIGNVIILILFLKSRAVENNDNNGKPDLCYEYVNNCEKSVVSCNTRTSTVDVVSSSKRMICRSRSDNTMRVKSEANEIRHELRRSVTEASRSKNCDGDTAAIEKNELSSEDFRRTVEAFIARQQKILRDEEFSPMVYIGS